jgi:hypothetical protein
VPGLRPWVKELYQYQNLSDVQTASLPCSRSGSAVENALDENTKSKVMRFQGEKEIAAYAAQLEGKLKTRYGALLYEFNLLKL